jgi:hypothetical protein
VGACAGNRSLIRSMARSCGMHLPAVRRVAGRSDRSSEPYWMRTGFATTCATAVSFFATGVINPAMMP